MTTTMLRSRSSSNNREPFESRSRIQFFRKDKEEKIASSKTTWTIFDAKKGKVNNNKQTLSPSEFGRLLKLFLRNLITITMILLK